MKTILAPTDFSATALNSAEYAAELAERSHARLILFHVYEPVIVSTDVPVVLSSEDIEKHTREGLEKIRRNLMKRHGQDLRVDCIVAAGLAAGEILDEAKKERADLIVMGMNGAGYLRERYVGNVTTAVIKHSGAPVISVEKHVKFKRIKKIVLACDYDEIRSKPRIRKLKELASLFGSHVYILNVVADSGKLPSLHRAIAGIKIDNSLEGVPHSFHFVENEDVAEGIRLFAESNEMDMIAMIPRRHSIFKNIISERNTKKMAFHSPVPLLSLHE